MARLPADRLLYTFRANAGLPVGTAKPLGGWEQPENGHRSSELRGHFGGHFLSASAQLAARGDIEAKAKGDYMVAEMVKSQEKLGGNYLSAFPTTWWDRLENGERVWTLFTRFTRSQRECLTCTGWPETNRRCKCSKAWRPGRTSGRLRRQKRICSRSYMIEFGGIRGKFLSSRRTNEQRSVGEIGRPLPEEELDQSAGSAAR